MISPCERTRFSMLAAVVCLVFCHFDWFLFVFAGLSLTPCPSSRNSTPAFSSAATIFSPVTGRPPRSPLAASRRLMVGIETPDALAIASCDQPSNPRAALICLINTSACSRFIFDTFSIAQGGNNCKEQQPMTRQVSKPNIFWAPSLETARKIDDEDTVKSIETARYRFAASMADLERCYDEQASRLRAAFVAEVAALYPSEAA